MEDHEKLEKIAGIRKRREDRALVNYKKMQHDLYIYETELEARKQRIQVFLAERSVQLQSMQNKMRTEAVNGQVIEAYLLLKENTQEKTKELYDELEEKTQGYYPLLDKVNESYKQWQEVNLAQSKLTRIAEKKREEFEEETTKQEENRRYVDFFGKKQNMDD